MKSLFSTTSISEPRPAPVSTLPYLVNLTSGRLLTGNAIWNLIQSVGRPDLTAKLHLFELPLYVAMLVPLVKFRSIEGAAIAWLLRFAIDAFLLFVLAFRFLPPRASTGSRLPAVVAAALLFFALASVAMPFYMKVLLVSTVWAFFFMGAWSWSLSNRERSFVQAGLRGANVLS